MTTFHAKLLIIDDVPENIGVLFNLLSQQHYEILIAEDGNSGLETAHNEQPDLILLDVMMPNIDGFEVCHRLKQSPVTRDIPVIFLTALSDTDSKVSGFELGAVDFITKPIQGEEVLARVKTHLTVRRLQHQQRDTIAQLEERNAELDAFAHTVAHDLKNPLGIISGMTDILTQQHGQDARLLNQLRDIHRSSSKMREIIDALLLLARVSRQGIETEVLDMNAILQQVVLRIQPDLHRREGLLHWPKTWPVVTGQPQWIEEVWANYLSNGLKYGGHPPRLEVGADTEGGQARFWVQDNGPGLDPEAQAKVFVPFSRLHQHSDEEGHGLGLSIVERIMNKLDGTVGVESVQGQGARFFFTLPLVAQASPEQVQFDAQAPALSGSESTQDKPAVALPDIADLQALLEASRMGDVLLVQAQIQALSKQARIKIFCEEINGLVDDMRVKQLRLTLEHYLTQAQA